MYKIVFSLFIAIVASASGTHVSTKRDINEKIYGRTSYLVYSRIYWGNYDETQCIPMTDATCIYRLLDSGKGIVPDSFTTLEANYWVLQGYLQPIGKGIYVWE